MISQKDIKLLWGRAASRCSMCKHNLTQDKTTVSESFALGEQAHIVSEELDGPRGASILTADERNCYSNLILLCPTCHTLVDKNPQDYPVEKLHLLKSKHEFWVQQQLAEAADHKQTAANLVYANLIDAAVKSCRLDEWETWTSWALGADPVWPADLPDKIFEFRRKVIAAVWPGTLPELERAIKTLSIIIHIAAQTFRKHSELNKDDGLYAAIKFYKEREFTEEEYQRRAEQYDAWLQNCDDLLRQAAKAANWLADVVRRDINPMFFAAEGRFISTHGPHYDLTFRTELWQFTEDEKKTLPESFVAKQNSKEAPSEG